MADKQNHEYIEDLKEIRSIMSRSSRFISLSGLSGISAGVVALAGAVAAWLYMKNNMQAVAYPMSGTTVDLKDLLFLFLDAGIVLILAVGLAVYFAIRKARLQQLPVWNKAAELTLINLIIPLAAGAVFCMILLYYKLYLLVPPVTLIFYGLALLNAGNYTLSEVRYLGISEIILGLIAMLLPGYTLITWATGFGILHIIYGAVMFFRYER
jgi:hypothetical protein